jgi:hypothetical protein
MEYDLVIIGGGPAGLTLAQCVSNLNKRILIIEREGVIGGCHSVRRVNGLFSEHGPRIYSGAYSIFKSILNEMGLSFDDIFKKYDFSISEIGGETVFTTLSIRELAIISYNFIILMIDNNHAMDITVEEFVYKNSFSNESIELMDRLCKLTDGAGIDRYTLNQFLQIMNQHFFYSLYQPRAPNDNLLFRKWIEFLIFRRVNFLMNGNISDIRLNSKGDKIDDIIVNGRVIKSKDFVFAIPPVNLVELISRYNIKHSWGDINKYAKDTAYIDYISVTYHWDRKLDLKKVYGFPKSDWGVVFIVLSDYMEFTETESKTVISTAVTLVDRKSKNNNKTADECNKEELVTEIYNQLREAYSDLPMPTGIVMSPKVIKSDNRWISKDTAFITTSNKGYLPFRNEVVNNMYSLGTHNGKSLYKFTSLEAAVTNAVFLSKLMYSELNDKKYVKISRGWMASDMFYIVIILIIISIIYKTN